VTTDWDALLAGRAGSQRRPQVMHQQCGKNLPFLHWMRAKARLLGHPIHPMLIVFPLGLLTVAAIFDIIYVSSHNGHWADLSRWMIVSGIIGGLIAAVFGVIDWLGIPEGTRARYIGLIHGLSNVVVVILFIVSWFNAEA
jgi:uncharacterized membrane protein